jgi:hypothetical protein
MDKQLLLALMNGESKRSEKHDFPDGMGGKVKVFVAEGETLIAKFWNSSNNNEFYRPKACNHIAEAYINDNDVAEGHFSLDLYEIWFEITEK